MLSNNLCTVIQASDFGNLTYIDNCNLFMDKILLEGMSIALSK